MSNQTQTDGGPAFPMSASTGDSRDGVYCQNGMSLRDYFAAAALTGIITTDPTGEMDNKTTAELAYAIATAMLAARGGAS